MSTPTGIDVLQLVKDLIAERDRLHQKVAEQEEELARLRRDTEQLARERSQLLLREEWWRKSVYTLWPKENVPPYTEEELAELRRTAVPIEQVLAEVDQILDTKGGGDVHG